MPCHPCQSYVKGHHRALPYQEVADALSTIIYIVWFLRIPQKPFKLVILPDSILEHAYLFPHIPTINVEINVGIKQWKTYGCASSQPFQAGNARRRRRVVSECHPYRYEILDPENHHCRPTAGSRSGKVSGRRTRRSERSRGPQSLTGGKGVDPLRPEAKDHYPDVFRGCRAWPETHAEWTVRPGSFRANLKTGRWADFAFKVVRSGDPVSHAAYLFGKAHFASARALAEMLGATS